MDTGLPSEYVDDLLSAQLIGLGFDAGIYVFTRSPMDLRIELEQIKSALFEGTLINPKTVPLHDNADGEQVLPLIPLRIEATFAPVHYILGHANRPDWYVRGRLLGLVSEHDVHLYLSMGSSGTTIETVYVQFVDCATRSAGSQLRLGTGSISAAPSSD